MLGVNDLENVLFRHTIVSNKCPRRLPSGVLRFLKIGHIVATLVKRMKMLENEGILTKK